MRSGSAHCHVCLSKERNRSALISSPDVLIAMNEISLRKFASQVSPGDYSLQPRLASGRLHASAGAGHLYPRAEIADKLGSTKVTNIVLDGSRYSKNRMPLARNRHGRLENQDQED